MKIARVVGARPQFMQVPPVRDALLARGHTHVLIHTGQHYDDAMSDAFFTDLGLPSPDISLGTGSGRHGETTGRMLEALERTLLDLKPNAVLIDGDTNSTAAAAIAAAKLHIPVCHIEAGLRDHDKRRPEEVNRILADHAANLNCAPLQRALDNLVREGLGDRSVLVGDVLVDCFVRYHAKRVDAAWQALGLVRGAFHVLTLHRPENTDLHEMQRFNDIMKALATLDKPVVFPVHPRTRPILEKFRADGGDVSNLRLLPPAGYLEMLGLIDASDCVFSDSGGIPREAAWAGRRCVMLHRIDVWHDMTERHWVESGKTDTASVLSAFARAKAPDATATRAWFGGGRASEAIVAAMEQRFAA